MRLPALFPILLFAQAAHAARSPDPLAAVLRGAVEVGNEFRTAQTKGALKEETAWGTGFIYRLDGEKRQAVVLTNHHVISSSGRYTIRFYGGTRPLTSQTGAVSLIGTDPELDLALLRVDLTQYPGEPGELADLIPLEWWEPDPERETEEDLTENGAAVVALGNAGGMGISVIRGVVADAAENLANNVGTFLSDDGREYFARTLYLRVSAPIVPGDSGGPLLNDRGEVIGVTVLGAGGKERDVARAVPGPVARRMAERILARERLGEPKYLRCLSGLKFQPVPPSWQGRTPAGMLIADVARGSPAHQAGLREQMIVAKINGTPFDVSEQGGYAAFVRARQLLEEPPVKPGDRIVIEAYGGPRATAPLPPITLVAAADPRQFRYEEVCPALRIAATELSEFDRREMKRRFPFLEEAQLRGVSVTRFGIGERGTAANPPCPTPTKILQSVILHGGELRPITGPDDFRRLCQDLQGDSADAGLNIFGPPSTYCYVPAGPHE